MEEKLVLYIHIHNLRERKLRISQIARQLKISRNTVYKYLKMTFDEAVEEFGPIERKKKLDPYRDWIVIGYKNIQYKWSANIRLATRKIS